MDLFEVRSDGNEQLLAGGLTPGEVDEFLDWWRYTKPLGPSVKIMVREDSGNAIGLSTAGMDAETMPPMRDQTESGAVRENDFGRLLTSLIQP
jgi:hypothetical protein